MSIKKNMPYINREISWLSFNERVLQEAADKSVPLIERLKFLGIFSNNRDEFYRVRVATVKRLSKLGKKALAFYDEDPAELLSRLQRKVIQQQITFEEIYSELKSELAENDVFIINEKELKQNQQEFVRNYFNQVVSSTLFPVMIDDQKEFPYMKDKASYMYLKLESILNKQKNKYALIEIPSKIISRFVRLPDQGNKKYIILLDDVIRFNTDQIFDVFGYRTVEAYNIKLTRDAELDIDSDLSKSILEKISKSLKARKKGLPVRFVYDAAMSSEMLRYIMKKLGMATKDNAIPGGRYHNFKDFINFPNLGDNKLIYKHPPELMHKYLANNPFTTLKVIKERDLLLHYPYHTYNHIINLLREASIDPIVESIKITLYRVADSSKIANALINAVKNGKQVTVLVELQARFDEEHNIYWANKLKEEGAKVIYGVPGLKVHSKCILISTLEKGRTFKYAHIGTGNFNEKTAKVYTDFSLLTADKLITDDLEKVFEFYENNFKIYEFKQLLVAPFFMRTELIKLIENEIKAAKAKKPSGIFLKLNSLVDRQMISMLYEANKAGVPVTLIIRGACSLVTELPGWSDGIKAYSIVDKYLEHTRVFIFHNRGDEKIFISSADWMSRNLDSRSEVAVPIRDPLIRKQIKDIVNIQLSGNTKVRLIDKKQENIYKKTKRGEKRIRVQDEIYEYLKRDSAEFLNVKQKKKI
ncbi:MAG: polyphosphate kinase 1 [Sphingobacteriaceae bacterium]|nr:polyphosphate kinase 1 [Sphingobacteriaceae bacterium]